MSLIYLSISISLVLSQEEDKGGFYSKEQIGKVMGDLRSKYKDLINFETGPFDHSLLIKTKDIPAKAKRIIIFGGFHGSLAAAAEVVYLAKQYCEDIIEKQYEGLYKNFEIMFIPITNDNFYTKVYDNKTDDSEELQYRSSSCGNAGEIDPDRNFEVSFENKCGEQDSKKFANTGSKAYESSVAKIFNKEFINRDKVPIIINIQGFGEKTLIGYASKETKLTKVEKYTYDLLVKGEYSSIGTDSTNRKSGQMVETAMNESIYAVIYNTRRRTWINMDKLKEAYGSAYDKIFGGLELALVPPLIDLRRAKENYKASESDPSEITFNVYVTNFYPFRIKVKLIIDLKLVEESKEIELKYKKITATKRFKYSSTKKDFEDYIESEDESEFDSANGFYGIVLDQVNFPEQSEVGFKIVFERRVSGSLAYTSEISMESEDDQIADIYLRFDEQYVKTTNKVNDKPQSGVLLLMFLVFVLVITTIICLLISKKNKYNRFFY